LAPRPPSVVVGRPRRAMPWPLGPVVHVLALVVAAGMAATLAIALHPQRAVAQTAAATTTTTTTTAATTTVAAIMAPCASLGPGVQGPVANPCPPSASATPAPGADEQSRGGLMDRMLGSTAVSGPPTDHYDIGYDEGGTFSVNRKVVGFFTETT